MFRDEKYNNLFYDSATIENMNIQKKIYIKQWLRYRKNRRGKRERKRSIEKVKWQRLSKIFVTIKVIMPFFSKYIRTIYNKKGKKAYKYKK